MIGHGTWAQGGAVRARACFTVIVRFGESTRMKVNSRTRKKMKSTAKVRAAISFPPGVYETLKDIARKKKGVARMGCAGRH